MMVFGGLGVIENSNGKLLIYASKFAFREERLKSVSAAVEKMAETLRLDLEFVAFKERFKPVYVYYKNGEDEPVPLYCDKGGKPNAKEVFRALRNMMFVLSFHPKYSGLRRVRKEIMRFS